MLWVTGSNRGRSRCLGFFGISLYYFEIFSLANAKVPRWPGKCKVCPSDYFRALPSASATVLRSQHTHITIVCAGHGQPWSGLANFDLFGYILANFGQQWPSMAGHGRPWPALVNFGAFWPAMPGHIRPPRGGWVGSTTYHPRRLWPRPTPGALVGSAPADGNPY